MAPTKKAAPAAKKASTHPTFLSMIQVSQPIHCLGISSWTTGTNILILLLLFESGGVTAFLLRLDSLLAMLAWLGMSIAVIPTARALFVYVARKRGVVLPHPSYPCHTPHFTFRDTSHPSFSLIQALLLLANAMACIARWSLPA
jgi:hypothetical protein